MNALYEAVWGADDPPPAEPWFVVPGVGWGAPLPHPFVLPLAENPAAAWGMLRAAFAAVAPDSHPELAVALAVWVALCVVHTTARAIVGGVTYLQRALLLGGGALLAGGALALGTYLVDTQLRKSE